jgi:hypothetical protein
MTNVYVLKRQIAELQKDMTRNAFMLKHTSPLSSRYNELMHARQEIMLSIAHRQYKIIESLEALDKFASNSEGKAA